IYYGLIKAEYNGKRWKREYGLGNGERGMGNGEREVVGIKSPHSLFPIPHSLFHQKINFSANCNCRDEPESPVAKRGLVILPKLVLPGKAVVLGLPKLAWLNRSKISVLN